jgi:hypothetical protein
MEALATKFEVYRNEIINILNELKAFKLNEDEQALLEVAEKEKTIIMYDILARAICEKRLLELRDRVDAFYNNKHLIIN